MRFLCLEYLCPVLLCTALAGCSQAQQTADRGEPTTEVQMVTVVDGDRVVYQGDVDLSATIAQIKKGLANPAGDESVVFANTQGKLPRRRAGYYREYIHPTPGASGDSPQRIVVGQGGEWFYTPDNYTSAIPLN